MKHFRKIWSESLNGWIVAHKELPRWECYKLMLDEHPGIDVSYTAFKNQCSRLKITKSNPHPPRPQRPLYSEHIKKGYLRIKIAQPNVWMSKSKWVYLESHPWEYEDIMTHRYNFIFLDGDSRNFAPDNIAKVPLNIMGIFCQLGGTEPGRADISRTRLLMAELKKKNLDRGEELGLTCCYGHARQFRDEMNRKARAYQNRPERKKAASESRKRWRQEHPEEYQEKLKKQNEWRRKNGSSRRKQGLKTQ